MPDSRLTAFQERVLCALAGHPAGWTLTGGAALAGFHTRHRTTRDLDLFWHGRSELGTLGDEVRTRLEASGLTVATSTTSPHFVRYLVRHGDEQLAVDLVAEPVGSIEEPKELELGGRVFLVDTPHEILVNKLTTLVQRNELRDLVDVGALLARGGDLERALLEAPRKDAGFSPLTLVWLLREFPINAMSKAAGWAPAEVDAVIELRDRLVQRVTQLATPGE
jgi:hypothetical protein